MSLMWKGSAILGLLLFFMQIFIPALAADIWVEGKEATGTSICTAELPKFQLSAETFLVVGRSTESRAYGICPISVFFSGTINPVSVATLKAVLEAAVDKARTPLVLLNLNSEGGDVWEALGAVNK